MCSTVQPWVTSCLFFRVSQAIDGKCETCVSATHARWGECAQRVSRFTPASHSLLLSWKTSKQSGLFFRQTFCEVRNGEKWKKWSKNNEKKNALYVSVNVFNTNALTGDTISTSPTMSLLESGSPCMWSPEPCAGLASCNAKGILSFLSYFKTQSIASAPGIKPATSRSVVKSSSDLANLAFLSIAGLDCEIDISKSIQNVRAQRSGMVQTEVGLSSFLASLTLQTLRSKFEFSFVAPIHFLQK